MEPSKKNILTAIGEAILLSSISFSIASIEMSSKFSVINFSKDQIILDRARDALRSYILIAILWAVGTTLVLFANHGWIGLVSSLVCNALVIIWIYVSYKYAFKTVAKENNLKEPAILFPF